jgi:hypothetical protein
VSTQGVAAAPDLPISRTSLLRRPEGNMRP